MKKKLISLFIVCTFFLNFFHSISVQAADVSLNVNKKTIYTGSIFQLTLKNAPNEIKWVSSNESVAQVLPNGIVVGIKSGKSTITATYNGISYGCTITVKSPTLNKKAVTMHPNEQLRLIMKGCNPTSWYSSNAEIAIVDQGGLVTALKDGMTVITAKCENQKEYSCKITVKNNRIQTGSTIKFGHYEQDNNNYNGEEDIEWIVLDTTQDSALVISKYVLDAQKYNSSQSELITWENSTLRAWLNSSFYNSAFSSIEQSQIIETIVKADLNPETSSDQGIATKDNIFLLSITEATSYAITGSQPTAFAISQGCMKASNYNDCCTWWLRTRGANWANATGASCFSYNGNIKCDGERLTDTLGIRPVMRITYK